MSEKLLLAMSFLLLLVSCNTEYNISGDSTVSTLDGRMLYLKAVTNNDDMLKLDSCEVVHGKFNFMGMMDSVCMGELYMDNECVMPIVIENGNLSIRINNMEQRVSGGSLNDKLYRFLGAKNQIESEILELSDREASLILSGENPDKVHKRLKEQTDKLYGKIEKLETEFIVNNYNNILGTSYFMMLCSQYPYPVMTTQIKQIMKRTSSKFHQLPYVREYIRAAESNMRYLRQQED
jgi:hypothetical protein